VQPIDPGQETVLACIAHRQTNEQGIKASQRVASNSEGARAASCVSGLETRQLVRLKARRRSGVDEWPYNVHCAVITIHEALRLTNALASLASMESHCCVAYRLTCSYSSTSADK